MLWVVVLIRCFSGALLMSIHTFPCTNKKKQFLNTPLIWSYRKDYTAKGNNSDMEIVISLMATLRGTNLLPQGANSFLREQTPIFEWFQLRERHLPISKSCPPLHNDIKILQVCLFPLNLSFASSFQPLFTSRHWIHLANFLPFLTRETTFVSSCLLSCTPIPF